MTIAAKKTKTLPWQSYITGIQDCNLKTNQNYHQFRTNNHHKREMYQGMGPKTGELLPKMRRSHQGTQLYNQEGEFQTHILQEGACKPPKKPWFWEKNFQPRIPLNCKIIQKAARTPNKSTKRRPNSYPNRGRNYSWVTITATQRKGRGGGEFDYQRVSTATIRNSGNRWQPIQPLPRYQSAHREKDIVPPEVRERIPHDLPMYLSDQPRQEQRQTTLPEAVQIWRHYTLTKPLLQANMDRKEKSEGILRENKQRFNLIWDILSLWRFVKVLYKLTNHI